jgi:diaminopimelate decarboxylase
MATSKRKKVEVENVNHSGQVKLVDGAMYAAMRQAFRRALRHEISEERADARAARPSWSFWLSLDVACRGFDERDAISLRR